MVLKLLVVMVAVSALEGVFGHPDKQLVNGTQSKANLGHGKAQRGRRLDKLACQIFHGICQRLDDDCNGVLEEGPNWCLHSRHFGCCIPQSPTLGCTLDFRTYRDGAIAEDMCIRLICSNGDWLFHNWNDICGVAGIYGRTVMPFVPHLPLHDEYNITGTGVYSLTQYGFTSDPPCGIDIYITGDGIECIVWYCPGLTVEICCGIGDSYPSVWVNNAPFFPPPPPYGIPHTIYWGPTYILFEPFSIYIFGPWLTLCINWVPDSDPWLFSVYVLAPPSLYGELYGLTGVWIPPPYPPICIMLNGVETDDLDALIRSWQLPHTRSHVRHHRKNPSSDHTGQVTVRPIIEKSMSDIDNFCEEINKGPCTILSPEKCEKIMDDCVSRTSNVSKPGHGGFIDSSE